MPITYPDKELYIDKPEIPYDKKLTFTDANEIKNVVNANEAELAEKWNTSGTTTLTGNTVIDGNGHNLNINPEHLEVTAVQHVNLEAPVLDFTTVAATNGYQIAAANGLGASVIKVTSGSAVAGLLIANSGAVNLFSDQSISINGSALSKSTVGLGNVDNTSDATKRTARVQSVASAATVTPNADAYDMVKVTAQAAALFFANPTGTPTEGQTILLRVKDNATARAITYDTQYREIGITAPSTTVISKTTYIIIIFNSTDTKWDIVGSRTQA